MRLVLANLMLPLAASAANLLLSNDDGWAEANIRSFYNALVKAGNNVVLSAPADNKSGTGESEGWRLESVKKENQTLTSPITRLHQCTSNHSNNPMRIQQLPSQQPCRGFQCFKPALELCQLLPGDVRRIWA